MEEWKIGRVEDWKNGRVEEWKNGRLEEWKIGRLENPNMERKNINRGFQKLRVWNDAIELYILTCKILTKFPFELKKTVGNCIDSSHSINRNIAEGYSRRTLKEYLNFLNIALGSCGEYYSCIVSFQKAGQISGDEFEQMDALHYKTENELIQLIKSLQIKMKEGNWDAEF